MTSNKEKNRSAVQIKFFSAQNEHSRQFREALDRALALVSMPYTLREIVEPNMVGAYGVEKLPALMIEDTLLFEGGQPDAETILKAVQDHDLFNAKLYRLKKLTVPVDMSRDSANALRYALGLAKAVGVASIEVIHVLDQLFMDNLSQSTGFYARYRQGVAQELEAFISSSLHLSTHGGDPHEPSRHSDALPLVTSQIEYGYPDQVIVERSILSDLVVMSATGKGAVSSSLFGSVSASVLKKALSPILYVPSKTTFSGIERILYASNFESLNASAIKEAVAFGNKFNSEFYFVHVGAPDFEPSDFEAKMFEVDYGFAAPTRPFSYQQIYGENTTDALFGYAFEQRIDLIVFVSPHRSFWEQIIHKSTTLEALQHAQWPMLVMRGGGISD